MENNELTNYIEGVSNYLICIKNLSKVYVNNIVSTIKQFLEFINVHKYKNKYEDPCNITLNELRTLTSSDIYSYLFYLAENHYKSTSRITKTTYLKVFFDYLHRIKNVLFKEAFSKVKADKRVAKKLPNYLSQEEAQKILSTYENAKNEKNIRNNLILNLFLNSGLRISEVVSLNISDISLETNTFLVKGKGNKERTGYLNEKTKKALIDYLEIRKKVTVKNVKDNDALILSSTKHKRIVAGSIRKMLKRTYGLNDIKDDNYSVHTLRHTCATLLYKTGINIKVIQELLGHSQVNTTEIYTHLYNKELEKEMLSHPLADFKIVDAINYGK